MAQYPALTHAHFAAAMVHLARVDLDAADRVLAAGLEVQRTSPGDRFPGRGLHWLRGLVAFRRGDAAGAHAAFDAELAAGGQDMFAEEYAVDALSSRGFAQLRAGSAADAATAFEQALARFDDHARSWYGLSAARRALGQESAADTARARADQERERLTAYGRDAEATLVGILGGLLDGDINDACAIGTAYLERTPPSVGLASLAVEPWMQRFLGDSRIDALLASIAARANQS
jgi:tetratricopeptide (TPR) repeat protein